MSLPFCQVIYYKDAIKSFLAITSVRIIIGVNILFMIFLDCCSFLSALSFHCSRILLLSFVEDDKVDAESVKNEDSSKMFYSFVLDTA